MILNGECGMFNPLLLECLVEIQDKVRKELDIKDVNECLEYLEERNR
jgi:putative two-component system response regulator